MVTRVTSTFIGQMQTSSTCPACGGEGQVIADKCTKCAGEGIIKENEIIPVNIPAGVYEGMQLTVSGHGNAARRGGVNGDLLIVIEEEEHPELFREENNLVYILYLSLPDAILGGTVEVPTVDSRVKVRIDAGTQPGKVLRLRGKGIPEINGYGRGDLLVRINVWIPSDLSREERKIIEKFRESQNFKPNPQKSEKSFFGKMKDIFE
jgi:molecular chaperone DnaJ